MIHCPPDRRNAVNMLAYFFPIFFLSIIKKEEHFNNHNYKRNLHLLVSVKEWRTVPKAYS